MVIGWLLRIGRRGTSIEERNDHIGKNGTGLGNIESSECRIHGVLPELLATSQQFRVDCTDIVEQTAQLAAVGD
jgi:hypothetical protein